MSTVLVGGCNRVDQEKFAPLYRTGKAVQTDIENPAAIRATESERIFKQFRAEIAALEGRTRSNVEDAALQAYIDAAEAYRRFLDIRELETRGNARDGRVLLGEGWAAAAAKFNCTIEPGPSAPEDKNTWYWVNTSAAAGALLAAVKENLTEANRLVDGQP